MMLGGQHSLLGGHKPAAAVATAARRPGSPSAKVVEGPPSPRRTPGKSSFVRSLPTLNVDPPPTESEIQPAPDTPLDLAPAEAAAAAAAAAAPLAAVEDTGSPKIDLLWASLKPIDRMLLVTGHAPSSDDAAAVAAVLSADGFFGEPTPLVLTKPQAISYDNYPAAPWELGSAGSSGDFCGGYLPALWVHGSTGDSILGSIRGSDHGSASDVYGPQHSKAAAPAFEGGSDNGSARGSSVAGLLLDSPAAAAAAAAAVAATTAWFAACGAGEGSEVEDDTCSVGSSGTDSTLSSVGAEAIALKPQQARPGQEQQEEIEEEGQPEMRVFYEPSQQMARLEAQVSEARLRAAAVDWADLQRVDINEVAINEFAAQVSDKIDHQLLVKTSPEVQAEVEGQTTPKLAGMLEVKEANRAAHHAASYATGSSNLLFKPGSSDVANYPSLAEDSVCVAAQKRLLKEVKLRLAGPGHAEDTLLNIAVVVKPVVPYRPPFDVWEELMAQSPSGHISSYTDYGLPAEAVYSPTAAAAPTAAEAPAAAAEDDRAVASSSDLDAAAAALQAAAALSAANPLPSGRPFLRRPDSADLRVDSPLPSSSSSSSRSASSELAGGFFSGCSSTSSEYGSMPSAASSPRSNGNRVTSPKAVSSSSSTPKAQYSEAPAGPTAAAAAASKRDCSSSSSQSSGRFGFGALLVALLVGGLLSIPAPASTVVGALNDAAQATKGFIGASYAQAASFAAQLPVSRGSSSSRRSGVASFCSPASTAASAWHRHTGAAAEHTLRATSPAPGLLEGLLLQKLPALLSASVFRHTWVGTQKQQQQQKPEAAVPFSAEVDATAAAIRAQLLLWQTAAQAANSAGAQQQVQAQLRTAQQLLKTLNAATRACAQEAQQVLSEQLASGGGNSSSDSAQADVSGSWCSAKHLNVAGPSATELSCSHDSSAVFALMLQQLAAVVPTAAQVSCWHDSNTDFALMLRQLAAVVPTAAEVTCPHDHTAGFTLMLRQLAAAVPTQAEVTCFVDPSAALSHMLRGVAAAEEAAGPTCRHDGSVAFESMLRQVAKAEASAPERPKAAGRSIKGRLSAALASFKASQVYQVMTSTPGMFVMYYSALALQGVVSPGEPELWLMN